MLSSNRHASPSDPQQVRAIVGELFPRMNDVIDNASNLQLEQQDNSALAEVSPEEVIALTKQMSSNKAPAPTPNIKKSLSPSTKSESLKTPTPKITRSITQSQQGRSKMALDDFIAASDRLSHFEAILAGSSQIVPSLSSLRIRRDQVQNIWAIIEQEYGRCSKALREDPSNAKDLTAIQAKPRSKESRLEALVERFWELEAVPELKDSAKYSPEQLACEKSFKDNVRNLSSGRFEVSLPFKIDPKILGSSFETAKRRFLSLERRVSKDLELKEMYDYVHSLQPRGKWTAEQPNLAIGALVVIHEDNTPPQRWTTGRIVEVVPGADGRIRVADVKTAVGVCRRPIHKLAVLPIV
ncbi:hypothetical protein ACLKA6_001609 [Drosophila palustris]